MSSHKFFSIITSLIVSMSMMIGVTPAQVRDANQSKLRVTVMDSSGAFIVAAKVRLTTDQGDKKNLETTQQGDALFLQLQPGKYQLHVEAQGFQEQNLDNVSVAGGANNLEIRLEVTHVNEVVTITQNEAEKNTDPRGDSFTTTLTQDQIAQLPDDPQEAEALLRKMAGPGALIRVNGFTGGKLPPKSQIREIRMRLNPYTAENHEAGLVSVDIFTKPGIPSWHGAFNFGFRDKIFNARNAFAPSHNSEQYRRTGLALDGPLWRDHTSLFLSFEYLLAYDSKTILAATPEGNFSDLIIQPVRSLNFSARVEHVLTRSHTLRAEYQRNTGDRDNLGVGGFDLADRAYSINEGENIFRISDTGMLMKSLVNEFRFQARWRATASHSATASHAIIVLDAFNTGGAQVQSDHRYRELELADNVDMVFGNHSIKAGVLFEAGAYHSNVMENSYGTFTFTNLKAYREGRPALFTQRVGSPSVDFTNYQTGGFVQDDIRVKKNFSLSLGLRYEMQTHMRDHYNFSPRVGLAWSPFSDGKTTIRAGAGIFYDWLATNAIERALRVNGLQQRDIVVSNPSFPDPLAGGGQDFPPGRIQIDKAMQMPYVEQVSVGLQRQLPGRFLLITDYIWQRGVLLLRSRNINAPAHGFGRPDPTTGNTIEIGSMANSSYQSLDFSLSRFAKGVFFFVNYSLSKSTDEADDIFGLPTNNSNLRAERGPSLLDARHRFVAMMNMRLFKGLRLGALFMSNSATPYNITTGFDDNGDTAINDRPKGVGRNSARGDAEWNLNMRLSWSFGFGTPRESASRQQNPKAIEVGSNSDTLGAIPSTDDVKKRRSMEFYVQAYNLFNHANLTNFTGVQSSPFFGHATAALPGRRIESGIKFNF